MPNFPQNPYIGQTISWQGYEYRWNGKQWVNLTFPDPAIVPVYVSVSEPQPPVIPGSLWFNTQSQTLSVWVQESGSYIWQPATANPCEQPFVYVSVSPPENPVNGTLWYQPGQHILKVYVITGLSEEWVVLADCSPSEDNPSTVIVSSSPPENPAQGLLWFNPGNNLLQVWVISLGGSGWRSISSSVSPIPPTTKVSVSPPVEAKEGDLWFDPITGFLSVWYEDLEGGQWLAASNYSVIEYADQAAQSAALAEQYAQQAMNFFGELLIDTSQKGIIYVGRASAGTLQTTATWVIRKSTFNLAGVLLLEQSATDVAWVNRYSAPYF